MASPKRKRTRGPNVFNDRDLWNMCTGCCVLCTTTCAAALCGPCQSAFAREHADVHAVVLQQVVRRPLGEVTEGMRRVCAETGLLLQRREKLEKTKRQIKRLQKHEKESGDKRCAPVVAELQAWVAEEAGELDKLK
jgi:hypothetical protein